MLSSYFEERMVNGQSNLPLLIGWSKDTISDIKVNGKASKTDRLNMWVQNLNYTTVKDGKIHLPFGYVTPVITEQNMTNFLQDPNGYLSFQSGNFTIEYKLPIQSNTIFKSLSVRLIDNAPLSMEIWNFSKDAWEPVALGSGVWKVDKHPEQYISSHKIVRIKATAAQQASTRYPEISLEGTVSP